MEQLDKNAKITITGVFNYYNGNGHTFYQADVTFNANNVASVAEVEEVGEHGYRSIVKLRESIAYSAQGTDYNSAETIRTMQSAEHVNKAIEEAREAEISKNLELFKKHRIGLVV